MEAKPEDIKYLINNFYQPIMFKNRTNWSILSWSLQDWRDKIKDKLLFRKHSFMQTKGPIWERRCESVSMTMEEFVHFQEKQETESCLYFDYKYMKNYFKNNPEILMDISWSEFGYPECSGWESTIWIGSRGAHTPCHTDTYGCNLIAQVFGRKEWILFPPESDLKPTRIPYEESSVYSKLNFFAPDTNSFKGISGARSIVLEPGDVLFLPSNWWHYVENLETAVSVNMWIPQEQDHRKRIEEALTQILVQQLVKNTNAEIQEKLLNPNNRNIVEETVFSTLEPLQIACEAYKQIENISKKRATGNLSNSTPPEPQLDLNNIIEDDKNISLIPTMTQGDFEDLLRAKRDRYKVERIEYEEDSNVNLLENIINSFCKPEILAKVTDNFLSSYNTTTK